MDRDKEKHVKMRNEVGLVRTIQKYSNHILLEPCMNKLHMRKGKCPFCDTRDTFYIDSSRDYFLCFHCRESGDLYSYMMGKFHLDAEQVYDLLCEDRDWDPVENVDPFYNSKAWNL